MKAHEFLLEEDAPAEPLEIAADLREAVDGLPPTAATWRPCEKADVHHRTFDPAFAELLGSWPVPEHMRTAAGQRWVNPHYVHAKEYSDLSTTCECGRVSYGYGRGRQMDNDELGAHADTCSPESQDHAHLELYLRRVAWLKRAGFLWVTQPVSRARLGFEHDFSSSRLLKPLGESYLDWYGRGKTAAANTMTILRGWGVDAQLIADAYGCSRQCVYSYKNECEPEYVERRAPDALRDQRTNA